MLEALVDLTLNSIVYCKKGMIVQVKKKTGKYSIIAALDESEKEPKEVMFVVSNELMLLYFKENLFNLEANSGN